MHCMYFTCTYVCRYARAADSPSLEIRNETIDLGITQWAAILDFGRTSCLIPSGHSHNWPLSHEPSSLNSGPGPGPGRGGSRGRGRPASSACRQPLRKETKSKIASRRVTAADLVSFAYQIASGMDHITKTSLQEYKLYCTSKLGEASWRMKGRSLFLLTVALSVMGHSPSPRRASWRGPGARSSLFSRSTWSRCWPRRPTPRNSSA